MITSILGNGVKTIMIEKLDRLARGTEQLLNQLDATGGEKVWANRRLRIEHGGGLMEDLIPHAKRLGVVIAENPIYLGVSLRQVGPQRTPIWTPCRSLLQAGVPLVLASDGAPGLPFLNPFLNMQIATSYPGSERGNHAGAGAPRIHANCGLF